MIKKKPRQWICLECRRRNPPERRKCEYCGNPKPKPIKQLIKDLDKVFSQYIRRRDGNICVTCKQFSSGIQAGHYKRRNFMGTRWEEKNVHSQCVRCNHYLSGNLDKYALYLVDRYGQGILLELEAQSEVVFKPTREWLTMKIREFRDKINEIKRQLQECR